MKKSLIIASIGVCSALQAFAQGEFTFATKTISPAAPIYVDTVGGTTKIGAGYSVDYVYATGSGVTDTSLFTLKGKVAGVQYTSTALTGSAGTFSGGIQDIYTSTGAAYTGTISLVIRAWQTSAGSYENAVANKGTYYYGSSSIINLPLGDPNAQPPGSSTALSGYLSSFAVTKTPEPSTIALGVMGLSLLVFRRRK
jgi:hypothetical protein